jgi:hypothetical protein
MATLPTTHPTLLDVTKRLDPDGKIDTIAELLVQTNEVLEDMTWTEGNLPTGHRTTVRTGLPTPTWRKLYGGVQPTKSTTAQITDTCGMLEAYAEIDKALADLNGNTAAFRLSEDMAHIEGMNQEMSQTLFYGNEGTEPEAFTGLAPRFNDLAAANSENVILGGGAGADNNSIWLVCWGPNTVHGIYPKGSKADSLPLGLRPDRARLALCGPHRQHRPERAYQGRFSRRGSDRPDDRSRGASAEREHGPPRVLLQPDHSFIPAPADHEQSDRVHPDHGSGGRQTGAGF